MYHEVPVKELTSIVFQGGFRQLFAVIEKLELDVPDTS